MTFNIIQIIGNGSVKDFTVTSLDPTYHYRFKLTAQNREGESPDSNVVEWGAEELGRRPLWVRAGTGVLWSGEAFPSSLPAGIWMSLIESDSITFNHYPVDWDGITNPLHTYTLPGISLTGLDEDLACVKVFPLSVNSTKRRVMIAYLYDGVVESLTLFTLEAFSATFTPVSLPPATDVIVMEDGALLLKTDAWYMARPAGLLPELTGLIYPLSYTYVSDSVVTPVPHLQNSYPVSLGCELSGEEWAASYLTAEGAAQSRVDVAYRAPISIPGYTLSIASAKPLVTPLENIFWTGVHAINDDTLASISITISQDDSVYTNVSDWSGSFLIRENLFIYGMRNTQILTAPDTSYPALNGLVNIHKMDRSQATGMITYADVGNNLLSIGDPLTTPVLETYGNAPFISVNTRNFAGNVSLLADAELVVTDVPLPSIVSFTNNGPHPSGEATTLTGIYRYGTAVLSPDLTPAYVEV